MDTNVTLNDTNQCEITKVNNSKDVLLMTIGCMIIYKLAWEISAVCTWKKVLKKSRDEAFKTMRKRLGQLRNHELEEMHETALWNDNAVPSCINCYRKYVDKKICKNVYTSLLFTIDSIILMKKTNSNWTGNVVGTETFYKILGVQYIQSKPNCSFVYFLLTYAVDFLTVQMIPALTQQQPKKLEYCEKLLCT